MLLCSLGVLDGEFVQFRKNREAGANPAQSHALL